MNSGKVGRRFALAFCATIIGVVGWFNAVPVAHAAFGVSPPFLNAGHLVPGATYTQTIYLVQDQVDQNLEINATLNVPDSIKGWISIDKGTDFTIPAGTRQFPVVITIKVPQGASLNQYSGNLVFTTVPTSGGQVSIALGANVAINLVVGNDIFESYKVPLITFPSIEEGWNPRVTVRFENDGNIPEGFDAATLDLYDQFDSARLDYITLNSGFPVAKPFTTNEYTVEFPTNFHLGIGDYWGNVTFYKNNQAVATQKTIFHVLPAGSLSSPTGKIVEAIETSFSRYWVFWLAGLIIVIAAIWQLWRFFKRKKARRA